MELGAGELVAGRFRVERHLDAPSGRVVLAFDEGASRQVVLKFLRPGALTAGRDRARFERELGIVGNLRHPHTVKLFSHDEHDGVPFIVFEYVPGEDLAELIRRGPWSMAITRRVLKQLLGALIEAHELGVLHRDLSPKNVRVFEHLTEAWNVKLLDFGLGRPVERGGGLVTVTKTGEVLGVPRYLAPEALRGEPLTPSSDLYSLGIMTLEVLLGPDALPGSNPPSARALSTAIERVPESLGPVLGRMLSPDPARRFASAVAVQSALDSPAPTTAPASADPEPPARTPLIVLSLALALIGVVALVTYFLASDAPNVEEPTKTLRAGGLDGLVKGHGVSPSPPEPAPTTVPAPTLQRPPDLGRASVPATGCGSVPPFIGPGRLQPVDDDLRREHSWPTVIPKGYDPEQPQALVVLLHGFQQSAEDLLTHGGFVPVAHEHGFVVVAFEDDPLLAWKDDDLDRARIQQFVEDTKRHLCIDDSRVFFVGHSQGGHILDLLMCQEWVRGVAFHSYRGAAAGERCLDRQVPLMLLNPKQSRNVPYEGGVNCSGQNKSAVVDVERQQRQRNNCTPTPETVFESDDGRCVEWSCETPLRSCAIEGGHAWPFVPVKSVLGPIKFDVDPCSGPIPAPFPIAEQVWDFFSQIE